MQFTYTLRSSDSRLPNRDSGDPQRITVVGISHICEFQHPTPLLFSVRLLPEAPLAEPKGGDSLSTHPFTLAARVQARDPPSGSQKFLLGPCIPSKCQDRRNF